jgi:SAM-dependent methyltransferase
MQNDSKSKIIEMCPWYQGITGSMVMDLESARLRRLLPRLYGEYALQLGGPSGLSMLDSSPIKHAYHIDPSHADFTQLPFAPNSIDLVLLPHVLEFLDSPRQLLSQCYQMLAPHGHLVIFGFSPWSLWGLWRWFSKRQGLPWSGKFWPLSKVTYWLDEIGYTTLKTNHLCFHWPTKSPFWAKYQFVFEVVGQFCWSDLGSVYMLVVQKQMHTMTPIRASWWARKAEEPSIGCAEPLNNTHNNTIVSASKSAFEAPHVSEN